MKKLLFTLTVLILLISEPVFAKKSYEVTTVKNGGSISGTVIFKGKVPNPEVFAVAKNPEVCGTSDREVKWVEVGSGNGLKNMVVYLHKVKKGKDWPEKKSSYLIDQKNCLFNPWLRVVPKGVELTVRNSDAALHNIHITNLKGIKAGKVGKKYRPIKKTMFNEGQPPGSGDIQTKIKAKLKGNFIRINCEAHNFMFAWMFAADNPYAVTTNDDGGFKIDNIPAGKYKLRAWHPTLGLLEKKLTVKSGGDVSHKFVFKSR